MNVVSSNINRFNKRFKISNKYQQLKLLKKNKGYRYAKLMEIYNFASKRFF